MKKSLKMLFILVIVVLMTACFGSSGSNDDAKTEEGAIKNPVFNPKGGEYKTEVKVTITTSESGAEIKYTLNGSNPDKDSLVYKEPIKITANTTIKAVSYKEGKASNIVTEVYTIKKDEIPSENPEYTGGMNPYYDKNGFQKVYYEGLDTSYKASEIETNEELKGNILTFSLGIAMINPGFELMMTDTKKTSDTTWTNLLTSSFVEIEKLIEYKDGLYKINEKNLKKGEYSLEKNGEYNPKEDKYYIIYEEKYDDGSIDYKTIYEFIPNGDGYFYRYCKNKYNFVKNDWTTNETIKYDNYYTEYRCYITRTSFKAIKRETGTEKLNDGKEIYDNDSKSWENFINGIEEYTYAAWSEKGLEYIKK